MATSKTARLARLAVTLSGTTDRDALAALSVAESDSRSDGERVGFCFWQSPPRGAKTVSQDIAAVTVDRALSVCAGTQEDASAARGALEDLAEIAEWLVCAKARAEGRDETTAEVEAAKADVAARAERA